MFSLNVMTRRNQVTIYVQMQPGDSARNHHEEGDHTGSHSIPIPVNAEIRDPFWSYSVGMKMGNIHTMVTGTWVNYTWLALFSEVVAFSSWHSTSEATFVLVKGNARFSLSHVCPWRTQLSWWKRGQVRVNQESLDKNALQQAVKITTTTLLRVILTVTLFCHSFWHLIWKYFLTLHRGSLSDILFCHSFPAFYLASILTFCLGLLSGILSDNLSGIYSEILSGIYSRNLSGILSDILFWHSIWHLFWRSSDMGTAGPQPRAPDLSGLAVPTEIWSSRLVWQCALAIDVRQCPLRTRGWSPAVPTEIWSLRLRSGSAHWDPELAVEVWQCPLRSGARGSGVSIEILELAVEWLRSGNAHWDLELAVEEAGRNDEEGRNSDKI